MAKLTEGDRLTELEQQLAVLNKKIESADRWRRDDLAKPLKAEWVRLKDQIEEIKVRQSAPVPSRKNTGGGFDIALLPNGDFNVVMGTS